MVLQGCREELLIGSLANGSASNGIAVFPNLGYKKDAFLELSLVSNNFSSSPNTPTTIPTLNAVRNMVFFELFPSYFYDFSLVLFSLRSFLSVSLFQEMTKHVLLIP